MICGDENGSSGCHLAVFNVDITLIHHYVAPHALSPYRSASGIGYASKKYLKSQEIQLATHSTIGV